MSEYQEVTKTEWKKSLLLIVPVVAIVSLGAFFLIPDHWAAFIALVVVAIAIIIIIAIQDAGNVTFKCPKCGQEFEVSAL
jgi:VIT1/CCC1 family predicted Fe2+/Mn2+ transporter